MIKTDKLLTFALNIKYLMFTKIRCKTNDDSFTNVCVRPFTSGTLFVFPYEIYLDEGEKRGFRLICSFTRSFPGTRIELGG